MWGSKKKNTQTYFHYLIHRRRISRPDNTFKNIQIAKGWLICLRFLNLWKPLTNAVAAVVSVQDLWQRCAGNLLRFQGIFFSFFFSLFVVVFCPLADSQLFVCVEVFYAFIDARVGCSPCTRGRTWRDFFHPISPLAISCLMNINRTVAHTHIPH